MINPTVLYPHKPPNQSQPDRVQIPKWSLTCRSLTLLDDIASLAAVSAAARELDTTDPAILRQHVRRFIRKLVNHALLPEEFTARDYASLLTLSYARLVLPVVRQRLTSAKLPAIQHWQLLIVCPRWWPDWVDPEAELPPTTNRTE